MAKSKVFSTLLFVLIVVIPSSSAPAPVELLSNKFYFPHFVSSGDVETTLIISNPGAADAEVVFTAYDDDGNLIGDASNPASFIIVAQSQARLNFSDLFKIRNQNIVSGWVKAESSNFQLSAWMMISLDALHGDQLDGLPVSNQTSTRMAFSAVFQTADTVSGIGLANPTPQTAHIKATLYSEGRLAGVRQFQIPPHGHRAWLLHDLFPSTATAGHVELESDVGVVGFEHFSQQQQWSAVPMQLPGEVSELVFPLPALDTKHWLGIALANPGDFDLDVTLTAWGTDLNPVAATVKRRVKAHGELISLISDLFSNLPPATAFISAKAYLGAERIFGAKPAISGLAVVGRDDSRALASFRLAGPPLANLYIESSEHGFFIIPGHRDTPAISADKDKEKDKDKDKEKDKCKDKDKGKDKDEAKDKCKVNQAPTVNAGPDQIVTLPNVARLNGKASDDGLPPGTSLSTTWTQVSGPGIVTFSNPDAVNTSAAFSTPGLYLLRLTASDGVLSSTDDIVITANLAPSVNAGPDQTFRLPNSVTLNGAASDDGLPAGSTVTTTWSKVSGPGTVTFVNSKALTTTASFSTTGSYLLRLTASDGAASTSDDIVITVNPPLSIRVVGNQLVDGSGQIVRLLGVNRSGTEYACVLHGAIFEGPSDRASVQAMSSWNINTVRISLNEHCWLGINGVDPAVSGNNYQNAIVNYVNLLHEYNLYAVLDLHWSAPGTTLATGQQVMANQDHSPAFWSSVASRFKNDPAVLFDLYNEPHSITHACWRDGCTTPDGWQAAGMQLLVDTVRATGATQPILISGNRHANDLTGWLNFRPSDPLNSLVASAHTYNFNACVSEACWNSTFRPVAAVVPFVSAEFGENDCAHTFIDAYMSWLDSIGASYLGWSWLVGSCELQPSLIVDYSGTPTNYGIGFRNHLAGLTTQGVLNSFKKK